MDMKQEFRKPAGKADVRREIIITLLIMLLGAAVGVFSKWLDTVAVDESVPWTVVINEKLQLSLLFSELPVWLIIALAISVNSHSALWAAIHVLLFFGGAMLGYHRASIVLAGFDPAPYMAQWYLLTLLAAPIGAVCWYGKSKNAAGMCTTAVILTVLFMTCFAVGWWYLDLRQVPNLAIYVLGVLIMHCDLKQTAICVILSVMLSFLMVPLIRI